MEKIKSIPGADNLTVRVYGDRVEMGRVAGRAVAERMRELLQTKDVSIVFASAPSQDEFLAELSQASGIDWGRVTAFHLDEYIGLRPTAPQAFAQFLRDRLLNRVRPGRFHAPGWDGCRLGCRVFPLPGTAAGSPAGHRLRGDRRERSSGIQRSADG